MVLRQTVETVERVVETVESIVETVVVFVVNVLLYLTLQTVRLTGIRIKGPVSPYRAVNRLRLGYKNQSVNVV